MGEYRKRCSPIGVKDHTVTPNELSLVITKDIRKYGELPTTTVRRTFWLTKAGEAQEHHRKVASRDSRTMRNMCFERALHHGCDIFDLAEALGLTDYQAVKLAGNASAMPYDTQNVIDNFLMERQSDEIRAQIRKGNPKVRSKYLRLVHVYEQIVAAEQQLKANGGDWWGVDYREEEYNALLTLWNAPIGST